ncbi:TetR family transcriptional regulator [Superficieibacter electus]|uniref:TetR family transcriptional regulator n=1 Tax=Superficieibacter electus TaxID=2022662 RepID=A0A2P5GNG9_9ENTR|nr:TetR family transcriptional regulator [Superficieibacter electus]POP43649.1 TetR family transcriptional regulator [Superficieibacter electus]POP48117.1 TetR family transcriptional regulator [Superficieibacter electus]
MTSRPIPRISSRKQPKQARSAGLVAAILQAAIQVLQKEGAARFTTARVAEKAGISIGSLYQYFPNKAAILFRLQYDEWQQTTALLQRIIEDQRQTPHARLRKLVHAFIQSECEEAAMRVALNDAAPLYRDAPQAREAKSAGEALFMAFTAELLPHAPQAVRALACEMLMTTLSSVGRALSETPRSLSEITLRAEALADMFDAWLGKTAEDALLCT